MGESLMNMREAEIKRGRLAMLAAVGWPLAELWDNSIASALGLQPALTANGMSPSILNGELDNKKAKEEKGKQYVPGDCGFDPLNLMPTNKQEILDMQTKEIKHGRIAMMAILGYVVQEALYRLPVTEETPFFFKSIL